MGIFNLSYYKPCTFDLGKLVPVGLTEVLPGDRFKHSTSALVRLSPMAAPVMHPMQVRIHHFFVPHRLAWAVSQGVAGTFEDFITGGKDNSDTQQVPTVTSDATKGNLQDHYGVPRHAGVAINALPFSGYSLIFNEYYRDQDLVVEKAADSMTVENCAWEKDYLTSSRPFEQKGPDITLPVAGFAPVGLKDGTGSSGQDLSWRDHNDGSLRKMGHTAGSFVTATSTAGSGSYLLEADLSQADAVKINEFRRAFALQRYAENRARWGSRYTEWLRLHGVTPSDARLDRPEYLGGGLVSMAVSEVMQTAPEGATPVRDYGVGDMFGHGIAAMRANQYRKYFQEHGYVHTMMSIRPKSVYQDSLHRHWSRTLKEDFWTRELEHIGQQSVAKSEAYMPSADPKGTFGYQDRYREYREAESLVCGDFRDTLNYWHLARTFQSEPVLNQSFTDCVPSKRIFNEQTQNSCWVMVRHRLVARRLVSQRASGKIM